MRLMLFSKLTISHAEVAICLQRWSMGGTVHFSLGHITQLQPDSRVSDQETLPEKQHGAEEMPLAQDVISVYSS